MSRRTPGTRRAPLTHSQLALFGLPEFAVYLAVIPVALYLPLFYSRDMGLSITDIGLLLMVARISDVITDPLIGALSDRTRTRFGRRKPWMAAGTPLMMIAAYQLFAPSGEVTNAYLFIWSILLWLGWTMINIPYYAWGAELSDDVDERTRITGWRQAFGFSGNISVLLIPVLSAQMFGYGAVASEALTIIGGMALVLLPLLVGITLWKLPERVLVEVKPQPILRNLNLMMRNGSFMVLFIGFTLMSLGTTMIGTLFMLFTTFAMDLERQAQPILLAYFALNIIGLPFWVWLSHRIGKREAWMLGTGVMAVTTPLYLLLAPGQIVPFVLITAVIGFAGGNFMALSMSMKADVVEIATRRSRDNIAGAYMAVWSLGAKATQAMAVGLSLPLLGFFGFDPRADNTQAEIDAVRYAISLLPPLLYLIAIAVIIRYPVSKPRLERLRRAYQRREARVPAA
ncbi:MAG: MFS transporter [Gammaproteobacteria bacterium]|nr:MAG: MFS transporter [Gammaproteobacteria bacterium]